MQPVEKIAATEGHFGTTWNHPVVPPRRLFMQDFPAPRLFLKRWKLTIWDKKLFKMSTISKIAKVAARAAPKAAVTVVSIIIRLKIDSRDEHCNTSSIDHNLYVCSPTDARRCYSY